MRRLVYCILILSLCLVYPWTAFAKGGGAGGGAGGASNSTVSNGSSGSTGGVVTEQTQTTQETKNKGEDNQIQNHEATQNQENKSTGNSSGICEQIMHKTRDRLQIMQQDQTMKPEDWAVIEQNLLQLKNEYRTRTELRQEIWDTFQLALQKANASGTEQHKEKLLKEMISLEPRHAQTYQQLGTLYKNRGEVQCHLWCNGNEVKSDIPPVIKDGRTLIPIRALSEALGAQVEWLQEEQTVLISKGDTNIRLQVQNRTALINGQTFELDVPADNINSRVFVPLRFCAQAFNSDLAYYPEGRIVSINEK